MTPEERNKLVEANMGLATHFAREFQASKMESEDMLQEAYLGLIDAAERFDSNRGTKFSTYARFHIVKRIMDAIHNRNEVVRTPRRRPSHVCVSLKHEHAEALPADERDVVDGMISDETTTAVQEAIRNLPPRDGIVIRLRYGVNTDKMTLARVGEILGVTPERVRQIQVSAEEKLCALIQKRATLGNGAVTAEHHKESAQSNEEN